LKTSFGLFIKALIILVWSEGFAQRTVNLQGTISQADVDGEGNVFIGLQNGSIIKFSENLERIHTWSKRKGSKSNQMESNFGLKLFLFYPGEQEYYLIDQNLSASRRYDLPQGLSSIVSLATLGSDGNIWVFDPVELRLMKFSLNFHQREIESQLSPILERKQHRFIQIKEHENRLFLVDQLSGILMFDNLGNFIGKINEKNLASVTFDHQQILYVKNNVLYRINFYSGERFSQVLSVNQSINKVLVTDAHLLLISNHSITLEPKLTSGKSPR